VIDLSTVINGREIAEQIYSRYGSEVNGSCIGVLRSDADAAGIYAGVVKRSAKNLDVLVKEICISASVQIEEIVHGIEALKDCDGILIQGPFKNIDMERVYKFLSPEKDIEGMCASHMGVLFRKLDADIPLPCTPAAVMQIIEHVNFDLTGAPVCIVNHSAVIGKPLAIMLLARNATVSICHEYTKNLAMFTSGADVVVCGVGIPGFLKADMIKEGAFVIDCGMNRVAGRVTGDADFDGMLEKCSYITPVPGGVGPVTTSMLFRNLAILKKMYR